MLCILRNHIMSFYTVSSVSKGNHITHCGKLHSCSFVRADESKLLFYRWLWRLLLFSMQYYKVNFTNTVTGCPDKFYTKGWVMLDSKVDVSPQHSTKIRIKLSRVKDIKYAFARKLQRRCSIISKVKKYDDFC